MHGETDDQKSKTSVPQPIRQSSEAPKHRMDDMFNEAFGVHDDMKSDDISDNDVASFQKLLESIDLPLYLGSTSCFKLRALIKLYHIKTMNSWTNESLKLLLSWLKQILPDSETLLSLVYKMKKMIRMLECGPKKIDVCPNHSMLMRWHEEERVRDGVLRHPADSLAWEDVNKRSPDFNSDYRNMRLGLASDGFNPFRSQSSTFSMWSVLLTVYNLPPWLCMKRFYLAFSLLIPGPTSPAKNIDVYLQPLIQELQILWKEGVCTYDALNNEYFLMHARLIWAINDFSAYGYLSGWSTQGRYVCPCCNKETDHVWLGSSQKFCYQGYRRFLPPGHRYH